MVRTFYNLSIRNPLLLILKLMMHMQLVCMHRSSHCIWVKTALKPYDDVSAETVVAMLESYNKSGLHGLELRDFLIFSSLKLSVVVHSQYNDFCRTVDHGDSS